MNNGTPFKEAIKDLNILNIHNENNYTIKVYFEDGSMLQKRKCRINMDADWSIGFWFMPHDSDTNEEFIHISFIPEDIEWSDKLLHNAISGDKVKYHVEEEYISDEKMLELYKNKKVKYIIFERDYKSDKLHFKI